MAAAVGRAMSPSLRQLLLLIVVAVAAALTAPVAGQNGGLADCQQTIAQASDKDCSDKFVSAVNTGNYSLVSVRCCGVLACVREVSCAVLLHGVCENRWSDRCDPPPASATASP